MNEFRRTRNWINQNIQSYFHNRFSKCDKSIGSGMNYCFINRMKLIPIHPLNSPFSQNDNWYYRVRYVEYKYSSSLHPKKKKNQKEEHYTTYRSLLLFLDWPGSSTVTCCWLHIRLLLYNCFDGVVFTFFAGRGTGSNTGVSNGRGGSAGLPSRKFVSLSGPAQPRGFTAAIDRHFN